MKDKFNSPLRKLARSTYWQTLYSRAKDIGSLKLFENDTDLTQIQIAFLRWLEVYNGLMMDLCLGEEYMSQKVLECDILTDAYLLMKSKKINTMRAPQKDNNSVTMDELRRTENAENKYGRLRDNNKMIPIKFV